jgi:hypothetical protein
VSGITSSCAAQIFGQFEKGLSISGHLNTLLSSYAGLYEVVAGIVGSMKV